MQSRFSEYHRIDETSLVNRIVEALDWPSEVEKKTKSLAKDIIDDLRSGQYKSGQLENFMQQYTLTSDEGIALMCLAESLLRIPDAATANALIRDKVGAADWLKTQGHSKDWLVKAAGVGLLASQKTLEGVFSKLGEPVIRQAMTQAMRMMGQQFVLGRSIEEATVRAEPEKNQGYRLSFDMLGEGARTRSDAQKYFKSYYDAITYIGERNQKTELLDSDGISIKLSALHPRYDFSQADICIPELSNSLKELCLHAMQYNIPLTVDAEEADRLEISMDIIESIINDTQFRDWHGFGLAVQAYQKRAHAVIDHIHDLAKSNNQKMHIRLVKGAYWDTEIKHAQVLGLPDYPVFTRKVNADISYMYCAQKMLQESDMVFPMFGTHNAQTIAAILSMKKPENTLFEFQRLHGMGEGLFEQAIQKYNVKTSLYAPVGPHQDLLPYLVRRLLENGANSSFVNQILDEGVDSERLVQDPIKNVMRRKSHYHAAIPLPHKIYGEKRLNSAGIDLKDHATTQSLCKKINAFGLASSATSIINGKDQKSLKEEDIMSPADLSRAVGRVYVADEKVIDKTFEHAKTGFQAWDRTPIEKRAIALEKLADLIEDNAQQFYNLCVHEAGKTIADIEAEIREAVDFCRYYAMHGRRVFDPSGEKLIGPTGESNMLHHQGRGIFVCISPWNFPLAIFTGQIVAALVAGNAVIAKPAEQTPLIAHTLVKLAHKAGIPANALHLILGDGKIGAALIGHKDVGGVAFTGSTLTAKSIQRTLAAKDGPIVPLIAETGGQNAMIVDSSALPEQVVDDAVLSAFGSAGQRCSALRILCLQEDIADTVIRLLKGAMQELRIGHPGSIETDIGPVIDRTALDNLKDHIEHLEKTATFVAAAPLSDDLPKGHYLAPCAYEIADVSVLDREHFGPILHIVRYNSSELGALIENINQLGYGLTLGIHSRIEENAQKITKEARVGNVYINRGMTGAVVGVQPFGGCGLSGTGPKAGGPQYLYAFSNEKTVSIDITASGGNTTLVSLAD